MPVTDKYDAETISLIRLEAVKFQAKIKQIDLEKQILDLECPDENKAECALAIQKILERQQGSLKR